MKDIVIVRGAGDIGTAIIHKLYNSGFNVLALETDAPTAIRRKVCFSEAIYNKCVIVEGVTANFCSNYEQVEEVFKIGIAVIVDPNMTFLDKIKPMALIDGTLAKKNMGISKNLAPIVIGVGPGFMAEEDVHAVIETSRGHDLGRIYYQGKAKEDTKIPGDIMGFTKERVLRSPANGQIETLADIKDICKKGDILAKVDNMPIIATIDGLIRGMIRNGTIVSKDMKIGDIDPRIDQLENCSTISDKGRCIAGGVLEALMHLRSKTNE